MTDPITIAEVLPCDVLVAPATVLRKGVKISTLMTCLAQREGKDIGRIENHPLMPTDDARELALAVESLRDVRSFLLGYESTQVESDDVIDRIDITLSAIEGKESQP